MNKSKQYFINPENILLLDRGLATLVGLEEAVLLNQLDYWLQKPDMGIEFEGHRWIYNSYKEWVKGTPTQKPNFPFWTAEKVKRIFLRLEKKKIVISKQLDKGNYDHTKYYRIDYDVLDSMM